ncbi:MAG: hypothetical protein KDB79_14945 [Acidobacteria bacterium]|nr:hypothetical protein [Acidobacteriota bacterium]
MSVEFSQREIRLKKIRDLFLKFHKVLMDAERAKYEEENGAVSSGKFLEMLLGDPKFAWLRTLSTLIVRIDESFDLDDGLSSDMVDGYFEEIGNLFDESEEYQEFKLKLKDALPENPEANRIGSEILELLS